jgi:hypothetical protein
MKKQYVCTLALPSYEVALIVTFSSARVVSESNAMVRAHLSGVRQAIHSVGTSQLIPTLLGNVRTGESVVLGALVAWGASDEVDTSSNVQAQRIFRCLFENPASQWCRRFVENSSAEPLCTFSGLRRNNP